jgi:hypothetical protein
VKNHQRIQVGTWFSANHWFAEKLGRGVPNPFTATLDDMARYEQERARLTHKVLGEFGLGSPDPEPSFQVPQHDGRLICATAYGAPYPTWNANTNSFWLDKSTHVWADLKEPAEVAKISIPNWEENVLVQENIAAWDRVQEKVGADRARELALNWTELRWTHSATGESYRFSVFPSFLDLGGFLMGSTSFLTTLAADPELAHALMHKCFELSASYSDFMCDLYDRPRTGWCSMGGDNSCLVSAAMYREYGMAFDDMVRKKCGNIPRNLHSCGASKHLYEIWGEYAEREQIVVMQTRAIPGMMSPLRKSLPDTYTQLTIHQPQVDFERESPERIREFVWQFAEAMDYRDASITVIFTTIDDQCKANLAAFYEAAEQINSESLTRS